MAPDATGAKLSAKAKGRHYITCRNRNHRPDTDTKELATKSRLKNFRKFRFLPIVREVRLTWSGGPIELLFIDCGGTLDVNETWFRALEKSFIPNRTLIVMQDWQNFKSVPYPCWVHTKQFTDLHADRLRLLHEIKEGGIACFLYTSPAGHRQPTG